MISICFNTEYVHMFICSRGPNQSIRNYEETFEKKNMKLPSEILAFNLLKRAKITKEEKTGINYENQPTLYDEEKRSLKQINDEMCDSDKISASIGSIKLEPVFLGRVLRSPPGGKVY